MTAPVVLITGCSDGGIGSQLCIDFHKRGARVYATARRIESMSALPKGIQKLRLDVTDAATIKSAVDEVIKKEGKIDYLVNNVRVILERRGECCERLLMFLHVGRREVP